MCVLREQKSRRLHHSLLRKFKMEAYLKSKLNTQTLKKLHSSSGCINRGNIYETDKGKVFVKYNCGSEAEVMFKGEFESLQELSKTQTVKVPVPIAVDKVEKVHFIVMEYLNIHSLNKHSSRLGELLAELHLHNIKILESSKNSQGLITTNISSGVDKFGFHVPTACGYLSQNNEWCDDWVRFYTTQKLQSQIDMLLKNDGNRELLSLWSQLQLKIPSFFKDVRVQPSLLHGDLWIGNAGETEEVPVIFDPATFYGHHEYDLAIAAMFGGFGKTFFECYHSIIPKASGFQKRHELYLLFHHLNHWNHFGSHKDSSLHLMRKLSKG